MKTKKTLILRLPINSLYLFKFASFHSKNKNDLKKVFFLNYPLLLRTFLLFPVL